MNLSVIVLFGLGAGGLSGTLGMGGAAITVWPGRARAAPDGQGDQVTAAAMLGMVTGTLGGMVGVGGGLLVVPLAIRLLGRPAAETVSIALAIGLLTAIGGLGIRMLGATPVPLAAGGALVLAACSAPRSAPR